MFQFYWLAGLGQADQYCTFNVHKFSCLYSTPGSSMASVERTHTMDKRAVKVTYRGVGPYWYPIWNISFSFVRNHALSQEMLLTSGNANLDLRRGLFPLNFAHCPLVIFYFHHFILRLFMRKSYCCDRWCCRQEPPLCGMMFWRAFVWSILFSLVKAKAEH